MPCLIANSVNETYELNRRLTSIGPHHANHVTVNGPHALDTYAHVLLEKGRYVMSTLDRKIQLKINGKKVRKHVLEHGDQIDLEGMSLEFNLWKSIQPTVTVSASENDVVEAYQKLASFCVRLSQEIELERLLDVLMDQVIDLSGADKGFLLFKSEDTLRIQSARNVNQESLNATMAELSDSIIKTVLETKQPLIVSDALTDTAFKSSASVLNLKLCSVICAPLTIRGETVGIIYLGNDNIVNLFTKRSLDILSIFASQAALMLNFLMINSELKRDNEHLRAQVKNNQYGNLIGSSPPMKQVFDRIDRIAPTNVNVLILGETGTGKELVAREIHKRSERSTGPFIAINCGALPENLMESEIFGHVKGAFTGAVANKKGCFELADGGTLFLDEIGEMSAKLQVKLLRAIQERQITRVGDTSAQQVDIRLLSATHVDLQEAIKQNRFREDLFYRINVVGLQLPPLRKREDDVISIARHLLSQYSAEFGRNSIALGQASIRALLKHQWPGNIRELQNRLRKAVLLTDNRKLTPEDLELNPLAQSQSIRPLAIAKEEFQASYIDEILALNNYNRTKTAKDLDVDPRTIFRHLEKKRKPDE